MRTMPLTKQHGHKRWVYALHFCYAALFAFVLPLICWGAQATPGHPHAKAHFIFSDPPAQHAPQVVEDMAAWLAAFGRTVLCTGMADTVPDHASALPDAPVGRSAPAQLAVTLLLSTGLMAAILLAKIERVEFYQRLALPAVVSFTLLLATPPPR